MKLTIEETIRQGINAHKEGNLREAERFYRAVLQSQPNHPDANHNLGVLAVSVNEIESALSLFESALQADRNIEQFWLSYIDTLIKAGKFDTATSVLEQAKNYGIDREGLKIYYEQLPLLKSNSTYRIPSHELLSRLSELYKRGDFRGTEKLANSITREFPDHKSAWKILASVLKSSGKYLDAKLAEEKVIEIDDEDAEAYNNLGNTLRELGQFDAAEVSVRKAIALKSDYALAYANLGAILQELGKLDDAEKNYKFAILYKPDFAVAHNNLGAILKKLGKLESAVVSLTHAITFKPDYVEAHNNLGTVLEELGRIHDAEASYRQAIVLDPRFALAYRCLGVLLYLNGDIDSGLENLETAHSLNLGLVDCELILTILKSRASRENIEKSNGILGNIGPRSMHYQQRHIFYREADPELISILYQIKSIDLDKFDNARKSDPRYGNGTCSQDFNLFHESQPIIQRVANDLSTLIKDVFESDIYIADSFFNILGAGGGTFPHRHLSKLDKEPRLNFGKQKYSLVYYLSVGDQNCEKPGILTLYEPDEEILPTDGMIVIFPADRKHSAVYDGRVDRIMIGVNFYIL